MTISRRGFLGRAALLAAAGGVSLREDALARIEDAAQTAAGRPPDELAGDEDFWTRIQQAYTVDRSMINLNNGGVSPAPAIVQEAMRRHLEHSNDAPSRVLWQELRPQVETVRERLADVFGCKPDEMAITRNASESLEICIYGMDLARGDEVLACNLDYPRMLNTYRQRELREGIRLKLAEISSPIEDPQQVVEAYAAQITPKTKVMLCSHVVFASGQIMPVRELCALGTRHGIPVVVDGAHAFAHLPFRRNDLDCEYYGTSLHKWLCAPHGTGFLYVRKNRIADLWPLMAAVDPHADNIRKFEEIGTHPLANRLAIAEAITIYNAIGPRRKAARMRFLRDRWARRLAEDSRVHFAAKVDDRNTCGFVTMTIDGIDSDKLRTYLWTHHHIIVTSIRYGGVAGVRVSPNVYTTLAEIDLFSRAVEEVLANGLPA